MIRITPYLGAESGSVGNRFYGEQFNKNSNP